jgi:hypothetical protein
MVDVKGSLDLKRYVERRLQTCEEAVEKFNTETQRFKNSGSVKNMSRTNSYSMLRVLSRATSQLTNSIALEESSVSMAERLLLQHQDMKVQLRKDNSNLPQLLGTLTNTGDTVVFYK